MAKKKIETRVEDLEKLKHGSPVIAIRVHHAPTVKIVDTGEEITLDEFEARYPGDAGVIMHIVYDETDTDTDT